jgi:putative tricarboxylic transport membrane protein
VPATAAERVAGALVALVGAWYVWQALLFREGPGFAVVGPRVFPIIIGLGLAVSGAAMAVFATWREPGAEAEADWRTLLLLAAALAAYLALYLPLGFPIASWLFFVGGAWILGSRNIVRDVISGALLVAVVYLVFTRLLTIDLPAGPLGMFV